MTLGFQKGASMSDPGQRLHGDGKQMRHIRFEPGDPFDAPLCTALIEEALRLAQGLIDRGGSEAASTEGLKSLETNKARRATSPLDPFF